MTVIRSERAAAVIMFGAAALGLLIANLPGHFLPDLLAQKLAIPLVGPNLSIEHWLDEAVLVPFFLAIAIELRREVTVGRLRNPRRAMFPAVAAASGILLPAAIYLAIAAPAGVAQGWPIPTATDIAFALGVLGLFGGAAVVRLRSFLLALAVLDDLFAIIMIAALFSGAVDFPMLMLAALGVAVFAFLGRRLGGKPLFTMRANARAKTGDRSGPKQYTPSRRTRVLIHVAMWVTAAAVWWCCQRSGVSPTLAGVVLGLVLSPAPAARLEHHLQPWNNMILVPLFAFGAAAVVIPTVGIGNLSLVFWAVLIALPVGKFFGIATSTGLMLKFQRGDHERLRFIELAATACLGGIGFTVALLMNSLAFGTSFPDYAREGVLAVLLGSVVSAIAAATLLTIAKRRVPARVGPERTQPPR